MFGQIDAAHAACAEMTKQFVLAKKEALVLPFEKLVALPTGDEFLLDQMIDESLRLVGFRAIRGTRRLSRERFEGRVETLLFDQPAAADHFDEFLGTQRGHNNAGENRQWNRSVTNSRGNN